MSWLITGAEKTAVDRLGIQNVSLLLHGNGTNGSTTIIDSSPTPKTVTAVGNAQISTAIADPFGNSTGVIAFDGNGDYLQIPTSDSLLFSAGNYTIEGWINPASTTDIATVVSSYPNSVSGNWIVWFSSSGKLALYQYPNVDNTLRSSTTIPISVWTHFAVAREGGATKLFINGTLESTITTSYSMGVSGNEVRVGMYQANGSSYFNGYIDDLRITKGVARYTSNFTPPTAPFPDI